MRRIRYCCATSVDGFIAGTGDEYDWIVMDPDIDFAGLAAEFDTYLMGRRTFEVTGARDEPYQGASTFVFSRTLRQGDYEQVTIVGDDWQKAVRSLREQSGRDIWLFGGASLFGSLAQAGLVDTVEVAVIPVILGAGISLATGLPESIELSLRDVKTYKKTGTVSLVYSIKVAGPRA